MKPPISKRKLGLFVFALKLEKKSFFGNFLQTSKQIIFISYIVYYFPLLVSKGDSRDSFEDH